MHRKLINLTFMQYKLMAFRKDGKKLQFVVFLLAAMGAVFEGVGV